MLRITGRKIQPNASRLRINTTWPFIWKDNEDEEHPPQSEDHPKARVPIAAIQTQEKTAHRQRDTNKRSIISPGLP